MAQYCVLGGICDGCMRCRKNKEAFMCDYCDLGIYIGEDYFDFDGVAKLHIDCLESYLKDNDIVKKRVAEEVL